MKFLAVLIVMVLNLAFAEDSGIISKDYSSLNEGKSLQSNVQKSSMLKIVKVEPTVLFRKEQNGLMQAVDITINNPGQAVEGKLKVRFRSLKEIKCRYWNNKDRGRKIQVFRSGCFSDKTC